MSKQKSTTVRCMDCGHIDAINTATLNGRLARLLLVACQKCGYRGMHMACEAEEHPHAARDALENMLATRH